ncbi:MAG TPA: nuclear transport factor 2 family protein [Trebonia sp.]|nr:nuclear transport factor 2 family protein [Trebonia sp.]
MSGDDRAQIRELTENWVLWRDAGDWHRFASLWHPEGRMEATWLQAGYREFIDASRRGFENGVRIWHFLGGHTADLADDRAVAQTKMTITQRADVEGEPCDVVCTGRFYDFLQRHEGRWVLRLRQPIYERDRLDPLRPGARPTLDEARLAALPEGYRHLAYLQLGLGMAVKLDMPQLTGPATADLYARGRAWLAGKPLD